MHRFVVTLRFAALAIPLVALPAAAADTLTSGKPAPPRLRPRGAVQTIGCGDSRTGTLEPSDEALNDGTWLDFFTFTIGERTRVELAVSADDFEGFLFVLDADEIEVTRGPAPLVTDLDPGVYSLVVNNFALLPDGAYGYTFNVTCSEAAPPLTCGGQVSGQLDAGDPELSDGTWYESYDFELDEASSVTFTMSGSTFENYVFVIDVSGGAIRQGPTPLRATLPPGRYDVWANNFEALDPGAAYPYDLAAACAAPQAELACGQSVEGVLGEGDSELPDGTWIESYFISLDAATSARFEITGADFAGYVLVTDANGMPLDDGDGPTPFTLELPAGGYFVYANNEAPLASGQYEYTLMLSCGGEPGCTGDCDGGGDVAINELIIGVNIALGSANVSQCASFDTDGNGEVAINELVLGVNSALNGCPA